MAEHAVVRNIEVIGEASKTPHAARMAFASTSVAHWLRLLPANFLAFGA